MTTHNRWLHRYAIFVVFSTAVLLYWGGLVTSTGSGLAVPDWPLSYGMLMPPMVGGIFYEHGHRMVATFVGLLTIILALWLHKKDERLWMRILGWTALGVVIFQGILGGITVLFFLPVSISVFHATLAQTFFCITIAIALFTSRFWKQTKPHSLEPKTNSIRMISVVLLAVVYFQLIVGAIMRHMEAGLAIPDFPLAFGRIIPPIESADVLIHFTHRIGAVLVTAVILWFVIHVFRNYATVKAFVIPSVLFLLLLTIQITLGAYVIWSGKAVMITTLHLVTGAFLLGNSATVLLLSHRLVSPEATHVTVPISTQQAQ